VRELLFIFDWDGTLSDSTARITAAMQQAATDLSIPVPSVSAVHNIIGLGLPESLSVLFPQMDESAHHQVRARYSENYLQLDKQPAPLFEGALDTLSALREQGHLLAVATGKSRAGLNRILGALNMEHYFDASRCADETASKPHPLMLEQLLEQFSLTAADAVMIGDTTYDMEMAQRANMSRIAVTFGAHHIDRLLPYQPLMQLDTIPQLLGWSSIAGNKLEYAQSLK